MTFLTASALAIALLVGIPILAHLLLRGRVHERPFPAAALVPQRRAVARQTSRLEDRALLAFRALLIVVLAALAATPLVRCSRLSLARRSGASVALAIVLDDSLSMRARTRDGVERWPRALRGATELLRSAREGDSITLVLAGRPARLALAPTTDLAAARRALDELVVSDRATDLDGAVQIARSVIQPLPHVDKRIVLLSDLGGAPVSAGTPAVSAPIAELAHPADDCGIASAVRSGTNITIDVRCSSERAATSRRIELFAPSGSTLGEPQTLAPKAGAQTLALSTIATAPVDGVRLTGSDAIEQDDRAAVSADTAGTAVGVVSDPARSSVATGGPTLLSQALDALERPLNPRPLALMPDDAKELADLSALIVDDPPGLTPEMRAALVSWVERGGVALALLGPRAEETQLGSNLEPFARGSVHWETTDAHGVDAASAGGLGREADSLVDLAPRGRARLGGAEMPGARTLARWNDAQPWALERDLGMGLLFTIGLPSSPDESDLALRPGFLALLDRVLTEASHRSGARTSFVGTPWSFPADAQVEIQGPRGKLDVSSPGRRAEASTNGPQVAFADVSGRYRVRVDGEEHERVVWVDPDEITASSASIKADGVTLTAGTSTPDVDVTPEAALVILGLLAGELGLRALGRIRARARTA